MKLYDPTQIYGREICKHENEIVLNIGKRKKLEKGGIYSTFLKEFVEQKSESTDYSRLNLL